MKTIKVSESELNSVNNIYASIDFKPSDLSIDQVIGFLDKDEFIALGRITKYGDVFEMGGIYTNDLYRGQGLARKICEHLIALVDIGQTIYCLPFEPLLKFYKSLGFEEVDSLENVHSDVLSKYHWCNDGRYEEKVYLLKLIK